MSARAGCFSVRLRIGKPETCLLWKTSGKQLKIRSPLAKYLSFSARPKRPATWRPAFGHTYCRDFAVLARFKIFKDPEDESSEYYYHYFVGGIRGLGTWGVGYLIDHESSRLVRIATAATNKQHSDDLQLLLEITYENFRITRVRNVTSKPASFFRERMSDFYIKKQLKRHPQWLLS
jgi:hypothetical protein